MEHLLSPKHSVLHSMGTAREMLGKKTFVKHPQPHLQACVSLLESLLFSSWAQGSQKVLGKRKTSPFLLIFALLGVI